MFSAISHKEVEKEGRGLCFAEGLCRKLGCASALCRSENESSACAWKLISTVEVHWGTSRNRFVRSIAHVEMGTLLAEK